jgi:hypothetical protein
MEENFYENLGKNKIKNIYSIENNNIIEHLFKKYSTENNNIIRPTPYKSELVIDFGPTYKRIFAQLQSLGQGLQKSFPKRRVIDENELLEMSLRIGDLRAEATRARIHRNRLKPGTPDHQRLIQKQLEYNVEAALLRAERDPPRL